MNITILLQDVDGDEEKRRRTEENIYVYVYRKTSIEYLQPLLSVIISYVYGLMHFVCLHEEKKNAFVDHTL